MIAAYAGSELMQILLPALGSQKLIHKHVFAGWITFPFNPYVSSLAFAQVFVVADRLRDGRRRIYLKL